ncbi:ISL3 family transposase [Eoetvoesiella caeni]|uniref:Transposase n=1 Tax=Eoetvoesiella caeni TaxID=645616 RepID=A0A366H5B1_9BURK|nr:ISL3 family transposase [Eoetvoesiella caeni]MCI2810250.1 ISL3 family transposase [Eoetvoesiella caeni]NYT54619.1 ISL3 family transposase [Eoetvoesiella caeni]RBP37217.1 transposase [Eoetvoesiella caeni]
MSPVDFILGLKELTIERVERRRDIHVWARPAKRPVCLHCQAASVRIKATHPRTLKHTRQGNQLMVLHLSVPKYHCTDCNRYFRHRFAGIRPRLRSTETYRLEVFEAHEGGVSQRQLTVTHGLGSATVERWYQSFVKQRVSELSGRSCPQVLGIDEHFFSRKKGYATTLVDLKNHKVFDVVLGRSEPSLRRYLSRLPGREQVKVVVMDLSETYRQIVRQYFPNAKIVADRFHVVRLVNQHFLKLWQQHDPEGRKHRGLLSLMRRHAWNLSAEQRQRLAQYLEQYPVLKALYRAKQRLMRFLLLKTLNRQRAQKLLPRFLALIEQFANSPAKTLAATLTSWLEPIVGMWRFSKSNGITEGFHTKMEMISRRAFGFRNFENYRMRVLALCGWNGVINRV